MRRSIAVITDGSPDAAALARWLAERSAPIAVVDALGVGDARKVADARRATGERVLVLHDDAASDVAGEAALDAVRGWLGSLGPFERRMCGANIIEERVRAGAPGASDVERLLRRLAPARHLGTKVARTTPTNTSAGKVRRGRPRGSDPFRGAGLDVCVRLLLEPERSWTERGLAEACGRSPHAVHRVAVELAERGYLRRARGAIQLARLLALRDDLAAAWAIRRSQRSIRGWIAPRRDQRDHDVHAAFARAGVDAWLAGPSASGATGALRGGALTVYAGPEADAALLSASFRPTRGAPDAVLWDIDEAAIRAAPRRLGDFEATNRVITYLDLVASGIDRYADAARTVWEDAA